MEKENREPTGNSDHSVEGSLEKDNGDVAGPKGAHLENIRTISRVPGNPNYYEKDGLRTYGDDEDHEHEPPVSCMAAQNADEMSNK